MGQNPTPDNKPLSELETHYQAKLVNEAFTKFKGKLAFEQPVSLIKTRWGWCLSPPGDVFVTGSLRAFGIYSDTELQVLGSLIDSTSRVLVVGANVGTLAVPLAMRANEVVAYEPQPLIYKLLEANAAINNVEHKLLCRNAAVGAEAGRIKVPVVNMGAVCNMGMVGKANWGEGVEVPLVDIKLEVDQYYDLIVLDVEGMEVEILKAMANNLKYIQETAPDALPILWVECDRGGEYQDETVQTILDLGYKPYWCITPLASRDVNIEDPASNPFGMQCSFNLLCMPQGGESAIGGLREARVNQHEAGPGCKPEWITWQLN
jgi:FkbM family methyltransferase